MKGSIFKDEKIKYHSYVKEIVEKKYNETGLRTNFDELDSENQEYLCGLYLLSDVKGYSWDFFPDLSIFDKERLSFLLANIFTLTDINNMKDRINKEYDYHINLIEFMREAAILAIKKNIQKDMNNYYFDLKKKEEYEAQEKDNDYFKRGHELKCYIRTNYK